VSTPGESYEEWLARTAPKQPVRTVNPRTWNWGAIVLLGLFFLWVVTSGTPGGWIGIAMVVVLGAEHVVRGRLPEARQRLLLRGSTLLLTLLLSGVLIWTVGGTQLVVPFVLVLMDVTDDGSFLRRSLDRLRGARPGRTTDRSR
jgi:hypothetical protein